MLHEFITANRAAIIACAKAKVRTRSWSPASSDELETGVPLFLTQLTETLRQGPGAFRPTDAGIGMSGALHGRNLIELGFTIAQVVHDYGDVCQAITETAIGMDAAITIDEFRTLNRCLDIAIAGAVTEHARITAESPSTSELERSAHVAHELRDMLNTAVLAFHALKTGAIAINGSTGAVLGRSLTGLGHLIDNTVAQARMSLPLSQEEVQVGAFLDTIALKAALTAESKGVQFVVELQDRTAKICGDLPVLASAVMNLLNNAFKFTPSGGRVALRVSADGASLIVEVQDQCGGFPAMTGDPFAPFVLRRSGDRSGLGLGLSIARQAARAHGGDIVIRNLPGEGCVFVLSLPLA